MKSFSGIRERRIEVRNYDLGATLESGQAFGWNRLEDGWHGVIDGDWVWLLPVDHGVLLRSTKKRKGLEDAVRHYLQTDLEFAKVVRTFPKDASMKAAVKACKGLRLLRQDPWECLASFILSSTKQITQIRQIVALLCERYGEPVKAPSQLGMIHAFPSAERIAACSEEELRACKMGFRAPNLLHAAKEVSSGRLQLASLRELPCEDARERLVELRGVGRKIADCVLLFAYGFQEAFPVDVWVHRALKELYFADSEDVSKDELVAFSESAFGPWGGYAQQYLFHYMRTVIGRSKND